MGTAMLERALEIADEPWLGRVTRLSDRLISKFIGGEPGRDIWAACSAPCHTDRDCSGSCGICGLDSRCQ